MRNLKKAIVKRGICVLLTAAMLCADSGVTVYATAGSGQEILEKTIEETLAGETQAEDDMQAKEPSVNDGQIEDSTMGEMQTEDGQTKEPSKENERTEGDLAEEGETGELSSEQIPVKGANTDENSDGKNAEAGVTEENPVMEDGMAEENSDIDNAENTGDLSVEESVSENDIEEDMEVNLETATKAVGDNIASGEYKENGNNITWVIDGDGKLTVEGTGNVSGTSNFDRAPWYNDRDFVISAEINVIGMTNASYMFNGCRNLTDLELSKFDTSNVEYMDSMFSHCSSLTSLDLSKFATGNVTKMGYMFYGCSSLTSLDLSKFDTSNVTDMGKMFERCSSLTSIEVGSFDTSNVTNMDYMFYGCSSLASLDLSKFDTSNVIDMAGMFEFCSSLTSLDLSKFDTSNAKYMSNMFFGCNSLTSIEVGSFDTSNVIDMGWMFDGCSSLTSIEIGSFDTSNVTDMAGMFYGCSNLTSLDLSKFATGNITDIGGMFNGCGNLTGLDLSKFDTSNITDMGGMFYGCSSLTSLDVSSFDTSQVTNMAGMFYGCSGLTSLDLSSFDTSQVTAMQYMFAGCDNLMGLNLSKFNVIKLTDASHMFPEGSNEFQTIRTPYNLNVSVALPAGLWYQTDGTQITELPQNLDHSILLNKDEIPIFSALRATKMKINYEYDDVVNTDDLTVLYYDADGMAHKLGSGDYTTNADEIDMSTAGNKTLVITYRDGGNIFTDEIELTVDGQNIIASGEYKEKGNNITWVIDADGKLTVEGTGDFAGDSDSTSRAPWYNYRKSIKYAEINVTGMTNASYMFVLCTNLISVDLSKFDTSQVKKMNNMFYYCKNLTSIDLSKFDTSQVTDMGSMFSWCNNLSSLDLGNFNTGKVTKMGFMFSQCSNLTSINLKNFDTSQVKNMTSMFSGCTNLTSIDLRNFDTSQVADMSHMFLDCSSLISLDVNSFDTSQVVSMNWMFSGCNSLTGLDLSNFNTSQVTDMSHMFYLNKSLIDLDVSGFNTSQVLDMRGMFCFCDKLSSLDLSKFDVSNLTDASDMLPPVSDKLLTIRTPYNLKLSVELPSGTWYMADGTKLTELPQNLDHSILIKKNEVPLVIASGEYKENGNNITWVIDADGKLTVEGTGDFANPIVGNKYDEQNRVRAPWYDYKDAIISAKIDVTGLTDASYMFKDCSNLISADITGFDTKNVLNMTGMFSHCKNLKNLDLNSFNTENVTDMSAMFDYCSNLSNIDVSGFKTDKVTDMTTMFQGCYGLISIDVSGFDTSNVTNMGGMFGNCRNLASIDVSNFDTSNVTHMGMFYGCSSLTNIDVSNFDTSNVTDMGGMFSGCSSLTGIDVSNFDTGNVTDMLGMFSGCSSLTSIDVGNFDTGNVTDISSMFDDCSNLTSINVSSFDTSNVIYMDAMFYGCSSLTDIDVSNFDTRNVIDMGYMFENCSKLTYLNLSNFDMKNFGYEDGDVDRMLDGCIKLATIHTPCNLMQSVILPKDSTEDIWYQTDGTKLTELPQNLSYSIPIKKNEVPIAPTLKIAKEKTNYICGEKVNVDDLTVTYYDFESTAHKLGNTDYTTNANGIDMSTPGEKALIITYRNGGNILTGEIKLTVKRSIMDADNVRITLSDTSGYVYDGTPKTPEVTVVCTVSGDSMSGNSMSGNSASSRLVTLEKGRDYTVTYENNINAFETSIDSGEEENAPRVIIAGQNEYSGTVSRVFSIQKAAAPTGEEQAVLIQDFNSAQEERTFDLSGCFEGYGSKNGYSVGTPMEDDTVAGSVLSAKVSVDEKGILTYGTNAGKAGDFAVIPIVVSFANYKDAVLNVKIIFENMAVALPVANPESGRQLVAGSKVTLTCETAGVGIYYTTGNSEKTLANPTEKSTRYTEPITINKDMYIKAIAIKGSSRSKTVTLHYTVVDAADKVLKPYAVPGQGAVEKGTKIELKSDTPDAVIYYVTGGNAAMLGAVPVDESHKYTEPIEVTRDMVIKAIAKKDGMKDSDVSTFKYKIKVIFDPPVADPASGTVDRGSYISLKAGSNANIYYTMDLSSPITSESAKFYENKIRVDGDPGSSMVIKAVAEKNGIYSEIVTFTYTVSENTVKGLQVMLAGSEEFTYTGSAITPAVIVTNNGEELTEGEDYTVRYSNNVKAAGKNASKAPKITVTGKGNLVKSRSVTFSITPKDIGDEEEVVGGNIVVVQGKTASPVLFYGSVKLTTKDFVNPNAKKKYSQDETITITGKGNFEGTRDIDVRVVDKKDLKKFTVTIDNRALKEEPLVYDGEAKTLDGYFEVFDTADKSTPLEEYSDYAVIYPKNNINAGKVKFTVVGLGDYYGTVTKTYTIKPRIVKTGADGSMDVNVYNGDNYPFRNGGVTIPDLAVTCDGNALIPGKDYKVTYSNNKKICTGNKAKCTISFTGNYKGSKALVRKFNITPAVLDDVDQINGSVSVAVGDMAYTGKPGAYKSIPYVTANGVLLKSADYKVSYYKDQDRKQVIDGKTASSSVNLADGDKQTVYVKIEGKGNYKGSLTAAYNVYRLTGDVIDLTKAKVNFVGGNKAEYTGEGVEPKIEVMYKSGRSWKKVDANDAGTYITVTYINNVNKGKATVMINGNGGKYAGSKTAVFNIVPKSMK